MNGIDSLNQSLKSKANIKFPDTTCYTLKQRQALNYIIESWKYLKVENKDLRESKSALQNEYRECNIQNDSYNSTIILMQGERLNYKGVIDLKDKQLFDEKKLTNFYKVNAQVFGGLTIGLGITTFVLILLR